MAFLIRSASRCRTIFRHSLKQNSPTVDACLKRKTFSTNSKLLVAGVDDDLFGLTEEQKEFRQVVYDFCQNELAPHAAQIDKDNGWDRLRYPIIVFPFVLVIVFIICYYFYSSLRLIIAAKLDLFNQ